MGFGFPRKGRRRKRGGMAGPVCVDSGEKRDTMSTGEKTKERGGRAGAGDTADGRDDADSADARGDQDGCG